MDVQDYPLDLDSFEVPEEPKPTSHTIPFAKNDIVGRSIHMLFQLDNGMYSFFKGKVMSYSQRKDKFAVKFWDDDTANLDFVSGGDTILWETKDITQDGVWKDVENEEKKKGEAVAPSGLEDKDQGVLVEGVVKQEDEDLIIDVSKEEIDVEKSIEVNQSAVKRDVGETEKNFLKRKVDAPDLRQEQPLAKKTMLQPHDASQTTASKKEGNVVPEMKDAEPLLTTQQKNRDSVIGLPKSPGIRSDLKMSVTEVGKEFLSILNNLKASADKMDELTRKLESFYKMNNLKGEDQLAVVKTLRGFLYRALKDKKDTGKQDLGLEKVWPLNDLVLKPLSNLHAVATKLCEKAGMTHKLHQNDIHKWQAQPKTKAPLSKLAEDIPANATPSKMQLGSPPAPAPRVDVKTPKVAKVEWETFTSTGNTTRDDAIKIFAHSLMSAETPFEIAVDIEHELFARSKAGKNPSEDILSDDYYRSIKGIWTLLNPDSAQSQPILRTMMLDGQLKASDLVLLSSQECQEKQKMFLDTWKQNIA